MSSPFRPVQQRLYNTPVKNLKGIGNTGKERLEYNHKITTVGQLNDHLIKVFDAGKDPATWLMATLGYHDSDQRAVEAIEDIQRNYY